MLSLGLLFPFASTAWCARINVQAFDARGNALTYDNLRAYIGPLKPEDSKGGAVFVTDLDGNPVDGKLWWVASSSYAVIEWQGASRIKFSLPWPIHDDGFSNLAADNVAAGFRDGMSILLNEELALTQNRLYRDSFRERTTNWQPIYRPSKEAVELQDAARDAMLAAEKPGTLQERARRYDDALGKISLAWAKMLYEHGRQRAHSQHGKDLWWGLTLDETLVLKLGDYKRILKQLQRSRADTVRLVFRLNEDDFLYKNPRSFAEYDSIVADLKKSGIRIMGSVLDSALWPRNVTPEALGKRAENLARRYKDSIRIWEAASEPNGNWLGGYKHPLPVDAVIKTFARAASDLKKVDPDIQVAATFYWWEATAPDAEHATFPWLKRAIGKQAFKDFDIVGLSVYADEHPLGLGIDPVFQRLAQFFPQQKIMLGALGYVEETELKGYWWFDPENVHGARSDLLHLYTGAACALPRSIGGGFWWFTLDQLFQSSPGGEPLLKVYRQALKELQGP